MLDGMKIAKTNCFLVTVTTGGADWTGHCKESMMPTEEDF